MTRTAGIPFLPLIVTPIASPISRFAVHNISGIGEEKTCSPNACMKQPADPVRIKFELAGDQIDRLQNLLTQSGQLAGPSHLETRKAVYYDTRDACLRESGYSLRQLSGNSSKLQLVTATNSAAYRYFETVRWQHNAGPQQVVPEEISPELLPSELALPVKHVLRPIFTVEAEQRIHALAQGNSRIEIVITEGIIQSSGRTASFGEAQFWLKAGRAEDLFSLVLGIDETVPLRFSFHTESGRGYALIESRKRKHSKRKPVKLEADMSSAAAFRIIAHQCLHQVVANEPMMCARDAEALHQVRIGLRRLKTALWLFAPLCTDAQIQTIKTEIRWFGELLGPARDADAFLSEVIFPLRRRYRDDPGLISLQRTYSAQRTKLYDHISQAANSARFRAILLDIAAWIETGRWAMNRAGEATASRNRPIGEFAEEELTRLRKKLKKKGNDLAELPPAERHKLRLHVKKMRYTVEFFLSLFPGKKKSKRALLASLKSLQSALGGANDIAVRTGLKEEIITEKKSRATALKLQHRAFAAGLIIGHQQAKIEPTMKQAERAYKDCLDTKPFWIQGEAKKSSSSSGERSTTLVAPASAPAD